MKTFELKKDDLLLIALTAEEQNDLLTALNHLYTKTGIYGLPAEEQEVISDLFAKLSED